MKLNASGRLFEVVTDQVDNAEPTVSVAVAVVFAIAGAVTINASVSPGETAPIKFPLVIPFRTIPVHPLQTTEITFVNPDKLTVLLVTGTLRSTPERFTKLKGSGTVAVFSTPELRS